MFSYNDYREILHIIKSTGLQADYGQALHRERFIISRHDVEYSVERALELARVEEAMGFQTDYFFQWTNNSYNIFSRRNKALIKEIHEQGHHVGLHFALNGFDALTELERIKKQIVRELNMLSEILGFEVNRFSIHRPTVEVLRANIKLPGVINAYQDEFFTFSEHAMEETCLAVKYMSDANHIWRYGYPDRENITGNGKVQILTHPFAWTPEGYDNFNNYKSLLREKYRELVESVDGECKDFGEYKEHFLAKQSGIGE